MSCKYHGSILIKIACEYIAIIRALHEGSSVCQILWKSLDEFIIPVMSTSYVCWLPCSRKLSALAQLQGSGVKLEYLHDVLLVGNDRKLQHVSQEAPACNHRKLQHVITGSSSM